MSELRFDRGRSSEGAARGRRRARRSWRFEVHGAPVRRRPSPTNEQNAITPSSASAGVQPPSLATPGSSRAAARSRPRITTTTPRPRRSLRRRSEGAERRRPPRRGQQCLRPAQARRSRIRAAREHRAPPMPFDLDALPFIATSSIPLARPSARSARNSVAALGASAGRSSVAHSRGNPARMTGRLPKRSTGAPATRVPARRPTASPTSAVPSTPSLRSSDDLIAGSRGAQVPETWHGSERRPSRRRSRSGS